MQSFAPSRPTLQRNASAGDPSPVADRCPFLGSAGDQGRPVDFASDANQCVSTYFPVPISSIHQENYCLSVNFEACPVYRGRRENAAAGASLLPLTAVGMSGAGMAADLWADSPLTATSGGARAAGGPAVDTPLPAANYQPLVFHWEEQAHPDFQADIVSATARRQSQRLNLRPVLVGLLLLALIPLVWWLWTNVRPAARNTGEATGGVVITLPTLMASPETDDPAGGDGEGIAIAPPEATTTPEDSAAAVVAPPQPTATPEATATATDLENIAATATALFVNATAAPACAAPAWWVSYAVEEGDTIEALATTRGISPEELIAANCLTSPDLELGSMLLLPPVGVVAAQTEAATATATPTATATRRATAAPTRGTSGPLLPTRTPVLFPTFSPPIVIIISTAEPPDLPPTDEPGAPPPRPSTVPTSAAPPTATAPSPFSTSTPPSFIQTATPPSVGGSTVTPTPTRQPTQTPPSP